VAEAVWRFAVERCQAAATARGRERRLKKLVAERDLEIEVMKEIAAKKW
jgi:hypothetical protein